MVRFLKEYRLGRFLGVIRRRPSAGLGAVLLGTIVGLAMMEAALRTVAWAHMRRMAHPAQQFTRADALKILCVGDSFTFGLGVEEDETYPVYLQNFLADRLRPRAVEVVNRGLPSRNSAEILWMLERALNRDRIKPDLVLIAAGVNDTWNRHWAEKIPDEGFPAKVDRVAGLRALRFAKIAFGQGPVRAGRFFAAPPKEESLDWPALWSDYETNARAYQDILRRNLVAMVRIARDRGVRPYLVHYHACHENIQIAYREAAAGTGAPMLNLIDFGGPRDQFDALIGEDGWHPNAAGNRVLGERIGAVLLQDQQRRASKPAGTNTAPQ